MGNRGFEILTNRTLRRKVVDLFEHKLPLLAASNNQLDFNNSGFHYEYITQNFILNEKGEIPHDYNKILNDPFYHSILMRLEDGLSRKMSRINRFLEENRMVLRLLEKELGKKEKD